MKCAFKKVVLNDVFTPCWEFGTDLFGRFIYLQSGSDCVLIAAFDFLGSFPKEAQRWSEQVSARTGIKQESLWYHELQIHAAPEGETLGGETMQKLIDLTVDAVFELQHTAEECDCFASECDLGNEISYNRERYVSELGGVTVWTGMSYDENERPYTQNPDIMLLRGYKPDISAFKDRLYFENPNDPLAYLFLFKNKKGAVLGSLCRFAAHPDVAVLFEHSDNPNRASEYRYNHDWTGYLCKNIEKEFGGVCVYLNGPCADLCTKKRSQSADTYEKSDRECQRIGGYIAQRLIAEYHSSALPLDTSLPFKTACFEAVLPMNEDFPHSLSELEGLSEKVREAQSALETAINENSPPAMIKRLIDNRWRIGNIPSMILYSQGFDEKELAEHSVKVFVRALCFGGYTFVGVPGESLVDMTLWLRSILSGSKTVPVDQTGGYYNYMATPASLALGGYTYWSSWVRHDAIPIFKSLLAPCLRGFIK